MHTLIEQAFHSWPGNEEIVVADLGQDMTLTQSMNGVTMMIQRVYVDANRVAIGCLLSGASTAAPRDDDSGILLPTPTLVDAAGAALRQIGGGSRGTGDEIGYYFAYDTPPLPSPALPPPALPPPALPLRLRFTVPPLRHRGTEGFEVIDDLGPFVFDLSVPVDPRARVIEPDYMSRAEGFEVTLHQVVVTPTEVRATLRGAEGHDVMARLTVDGHEVVDGGGGRWDTEHDTLLSWVSPLYDRPGAWTITVHWHHEEVAGEWAWTGMPLSFPFVMA